tara:strand:- start:72 stop:383 length:312 start_codon:yes stop_codon:yes gene_type:complete
MPKVARGHQVDEVVAECGNTTTSGASANVFFNGVGAHRQTDVNMVHTFGELCEEEHKTAIVHGSATVFVNNLGVARKGDHYTNNEFVSTGSNSIFAGPAIPES